MRPAAGIVATVALAMLLAVACGTPPASPSAAASTASTEAAPTAATPSTATPTAAATSPGLPPSSPPAVASVPADSLAVEDAALVAVLPATVAGSPVLLESLAFTEAMADPAFATNIASAAFGVVVAGDDLASGVVARPVEGVFTEAWFRDWRDSYNEGACAQSGGLARTAEAEIAGRSVYIGTCAGGLRTYHAWVEERALLVSAFAVGEHRFGERLMEGLRP